MSIFVSNLLASLQVNALSLPLSRTLFFHPPSFFILRLSLSHVNTLSHSFSPSSTPSPSPLILFPSLPLSLFLSSLQPLPSIFPRLTCAHRDPVMGNNFISVFRVTAVLARPSWQGHYLSGLCKYSRPRIKPSQSDHSDGKRKS